MVFCPPNMEQAFREGLQTTTYGFADAASNISSQNVVLDQPDILAHPLLTDATKFYLLNLEGPIRPFIFQDRQPLAVDTQHETNRFIKDIWFGVDARYVMGYFGWWKAVEVQLAA